MDPRLLQLYSQELGHLREMGAEFAQEFPRIASRLGLEGLEVSDPYVERLLEGFAFLAARVQLKLEGEHEQLIAHLLEAIYPNFLAPLPSMMVVRYEIDPADPNLSRGHAVPRGSAIVCERAAGQDTHCEFRSAHEVMLWPLQLLDVRYFSQAADLPPASLPQLPADARGGLRIRLRCGGGLRLCDLAGLDRLPFYISAPDATAFRLHELLGSSVAGTLVRDPAEGAGAITRAQWRGPDSIRPLGFAADEALLPETLRVFSGYRLLQEAACLPQRLLFFEIGALRERLARLGGDTVELVIFLRSSPAAAAHETALESLVDAGSLALFCTPAINLFRKRLDRIALGPGDWEHQLVADRTRPLDYEVHGVESVTGFGTGAVTRQAFAPLYASPDREAPPGDEPAAGYFTLRRRPRLRSAEQERQGWRSSYLGEEVWLSIVDPRHAPYADSLRQLAVQAWVTNRDLPLLLQSASDASGPALWRLDVAGPVLRVRTQRAPTRPGSRLPAGASGWQLVNHLSLNHLSLVDQSPARAAAALRTMLALYAPADDAGWRRQIAGLRSLRLQPVVRRLPVRGPMSFGSGIAIEMELDELAFQGSSAYLFGSVLERFFARHAAINSFTQTTLRTLQRGPLMRWPPQIGQRETI